MTLLCSFRRIFDQQAGIPLRKKDEIAFSFQPLIEQGQLSRLAAAIRTFNYEKLPGEAVIPIRDHRSHSVMLLLQLC